MKLPKWLFGWLIIPRQSVWLLFISLLIPLIGAFWLVVLLIGVFWFLVLPMLK